MICCFHTLLESLVIVDLHRSPVLIVLHFHWSGMSCFNLPPLPLVWKVRSKDLSPPPLQGGFDRLLDVIFSYSTLCTQWKYTLIGCWRSPCLSTWPVLLHSPNHSSCPLKSNLLKDCHFHCHIRNSMPEVWCGIPISFSWTLIDWRNTSVWEWQLEGRRPESTGIC